MNTSDIIPAAELVSVKVIKSTWSANDASMLISYGGKLIGISTFAKMEKDPDESGVRFHIGFDEDQEDLPRQVLLY